jgi:hypothetical protein
MQWTLAQVKEHPLWRGLTDKERRFFELLEQTKLNDAAAVAHAFDLQPQSVQVRLNQIRGATDTGFLYRAMMGFAVPSLDEVIAQFWLMADKTKDEARKYACLNKVAELTLSRSGRKPEPKPAEPPAQASPVPSPAPAAVTDLSDFKE